MTFLKEISGAAALGAAMLIGCGLSAPPAQAGYVVTLEQVGSNVVATGSGTLDLAGLTLSCSGCETGVSDVDPSIGGITTGTSSPLDIYTGFTGPTSFGSGSNTDASSGTGDIVGMNGSGDGVGVPEGYVSGTPLSDTATYDNATFTSLGVTPGTYEWTWGSGANADSFTLDVVPAPLIGHGLPVFLAVGGLLLGARLLASVGRMQIRHLGECRCSALS
jgi:hypothetical protein